MSNIWVLTMITDQFTNQNLNLHSDLQITTVLITVPENCSKWFVIKIPMDVLSFIRIAARVLLLKYLHFCSFDPVFILIYKMYKCPIKIGQILFLIKYSFQECIRLASNKKKSHGFFILDPTNTRKIIFQCNFFGNTIFSENLEKEGFSVQCGSIKIP